MSAEGYDRARSDVQKITSQERKKYVQFVTIAKLTKAHLDEVCNSSGIRQMHTCKDNNRAFFFSADLICEHPSEPWLRVQYPEQDVTKPVTEWFKEMKGAHDWLFLLDGRSRECNSQTLTFMQGRRHLQELMLLHSASSSRGERQNSKSCLGVIQR